MGDRFENKIDFRILQTQVSGDSIPELKYEPPITLYTQRHQMVGDEIMTEVQKLGVVVDKERLVQCLLQDRAQYRKGFCDAIKQIIDSLERICQDSQSGYIQESQIQILIKEMEERYGCY